MVGSQVVIREFRVQRTKSGTKAQLDRPYTQRSQDTALFLGPSLYGLLGLKEVDGGWR